MAAGLGAMSAGVVIVLRSAFYRVRSILGARLILLGPGVVLLGGALFALDVPLTQPSKLVVVGSSGLLGLLIVVAAIKAPIR